VTVTDGAEDTITIFASYNGLTDMLISGLLSAERLQEYQTAGALFAFDCSRADFEAGPRPEFTGVRFPRSIYYSAQQLAAAYSQLRPIIEAAETAGRVAWNQGPETIRQRVNRLLAAQPGELPRVRAISRRDCMHCLQVAVYDQRLPYQLLLAEPEMSYMQQD
jgi:hypothetical protein